MLNQFDKWGRLRQVILGRSYSAEFYANIKNPRIRACLQRIADETEEDFQFFEKQLKSHGVEVFRPRLDPADRIENYCDDQGRILTNFHFKGNTWINEATNKQNVFVSTTLIPKPPMTPRDSWAVIGDKLLRTALDHPGTEDLLSQLCGQQIIDVWQTFGFNFPGGNIFQIGKDIYLGESGLSDQQLLLIQEYFCEFRWHKVDSEGHVDGSYHPIKPGAIISLTGVQQYEHTFPGWDILYLPNQSWNQVQGFLEIKNKNAGKWWVAGEEQNDQFLYFVETWLSNWVGFVEETVFDVNCLVFDDRYIFVNNYNKTVFDFLKKHNMEPIIIPFRHRYFWDGGLHCCTLEIERDGQCIDYFQGIRN